MNVIVREALHRAPENLIRGRTIHYHGDSQAACQAMHRMYSPVRTMNDMIFKTTRMVINAGARIEYTWIPKEQNAIADMLSKITDSWKETRNVWRMLETLEVHPDYGTHYEAPDIDVFADEHNHQTKLFISRWHSSKAVGVEDDYKHSSNCYNSHLVAVRAHHLACLESSNNCPIPALSSAMSSSLARPPSRFGTRESPWGRHLAPPALVKWRVSA